MAEPEELVQAGFLKDGTRAVISLRDLGPEVSAGFWDDEVAKLPFVRHASAAPVLDARIVEDRFFVVTTAWDDGMPLRVRLQHGALTADEATTLLLAALDVVGAMHELGLSASGIRLRSALIGHDGDGRDRCWITSYGLHVDNDIENFEELRELALRVLGLVGGRFDRASGLTLPADALPVELERVLRRAVGLSGSTYGTPADMSHAVQVASGRRAVLDRPRGGNPRSTVKTRPMATSPVASAFGSDLLLAEDFIAAHRPS